MLVRLLDESGDQGDGSPAGPGAVRPEARGIIHDITRLLTEHSEPWPGDSPFTLEWTWRIGPDTPVNVSRISLSPHVGTHADAPLHYEAGAGGIDRVPVDVYVGQAVVVDIEPLLSQDQPRPRITAEILAAGLRRAQALAGPAPDGTAGSGPSGDIPERVLVRSGYRPERPFRRDFAY
ncbi:MAG TPA: cyclase family protein, partial [Bacillota bacterium]